VDGWIRLWITERESLIFGSVGLRPFDGCNVKLWQRWFWDGAHGENIWVDIWRLEKSELSGFR
jgi:hypothetical protein